VLLAAFAAGLWGTVLRPAAYEVRVRHEPVALLGMDAMELMAVSATPALLDEVMPRPGDRVKLAVRQQGDLLVLIRIEKL
jgi:Cu/Ag efflux protein CusF